LVSKDGYEWVNPIEDEPMKKRRNTPPTDAAAETILSPTTEAPIDSPTATDIAQECAMIARECAIAGAPKPASASLPTAREVPPQLPLEARKIETGPQARREPPVLPRVATLGAPISMPRTETAAPAPTVKIPAAAASERRPRRFALLAACVALSAGLGALAGSLGTVEVARLLAPAPPVAPAPRADASEEIRALKDSVAQLRTNLKAIGDNIAAVRSGLNASFSSSTGQLAKLAEAIEKLDRHQSDRHAAAAPSAPAAAAPPSASPETTGSIGVAAGSKPAGPAVVDGWVLRKAYRGAALVEGRYGIIEIEPGDHLPGVGRVEEIKRQDGRWVVVTARGLIVGVQ
jgi:hypothetical protein